MNEQLRIAIPVLWPAMAVAGGIMLVAWWPRRHVIGAPTTGGSRGWAGALAFALAFAASFCVDAGGLPKLPPPERWQWVLPIACIACGFGLVAGLIERYTALRWVVGLVCAASIGLAFHPLPLSDDRPLEPNILRGLVVLATGIVWISIEGSARRHRGFGTPLVMSLMFAGLSIVILEGGSARISLLTASVSAALGAVCLLAVLLPPLTLAGGGTHVLSALLVALCATAWTYGNGAPLSLLFVVATPLILRGGEALFPRAAGWRLFVLRLLCTAIPVAVAVTSAMIQAAKAADDYTP